MADDGWKDAKEAAGCLLYVLLFVVIVLVFTAGPKVLDVIDAWQP